jgi:excisionase family DNA binding protein
VLEIIIVFTGIIPANAKGTTMDHSLAHTIAEASARSGIGRTAIYGLINTGQLPARKHGRRTLILAEDLQRCLQSLPSITVKPIAQKDNEGDTHD